jgi:hypothetical protein
LRRYSTVALIFTLAAICAFPLISMAQRKPTGTKRRPAVTKPTPTPTPDLKVEAGQVAEQIKNVSKFIYVYGKIVNGLDFAADQARQNKTPAAPSAKERENKDALVTSVRNLRLGVENLARGFQSNPRLQVQYLKVSFALDAASDAEKLAAAGRYDDAGKSLITLVERLTDMMIALR